MIILSVMGILVGFMYTFHLVDQLLDRTLLVILTPGKSLPRW